MAELSEQGELAHLTAERVWDVYKRQAHYRTDKAD